MFRNEWIVKKVHKHNFKRVAELGVESGCTASFVIEKCNLDVYLMVEMLVRDDLYAAIKHSDVLAPKPQNGCTLKPIILMRMDTIQAAKYIADDSLDLVFIDASHGYKWVINDINAWMPKIRKGGIISGHDYFPEQPEVKRAVDEIFSDRVNLYCEEPASPGGGNHIWWIQL